MKRLSPFFLILLITLQASAGRNDSLVLQENFRRYAEGSDGSPAWHTVKGAWTIRHGRFIQSSDEYDCASITDRYLDRSFTMTIDFDQQDGEPAVGCVFGCPDRNQLQFGHLARFDGNGIFLTGYYQDGEFTGTASVSVPRLSPGTHHSLTLAVDRTIGRYSLMLDAIPVIEAQPLRYPAGYAGIQSSGGKSVYSSVTITESPKRQASQAFGWTGKFCLTRDNRILLPVRHDSVVRITDANGTILGSIGSPASRGGQIHEPTSVCLLDDTTVCITDCGSNSILLFSVDGRWIGSAGWTGQGAGQFRYPAAATAAKGRLFVADRDNNRIQVFDRSLRPIGEFGSAELNTPVDCAVSGDSVFVLNAGHCQIEMYRWDGQRATHLGWFTYGGGRARGIALGGDTVYCSVVNDIRSYSRTGKPITTFRGRSTGFILPSSLLVRDRVLYCADWFYGRMILTSLPLNDPAPVITYRTDSSATVLWHSDSDSAGFVTLQGQPESVWKESGPVTSGMHRVVIKTGSPGTTRAFTFGPTVRTIPPGTIPIHQPRYTLTVPAGEKTDIVTRLPMAAILFANVIDSTRKHPAGVEPACIRQVEVDRIRRQIEDGIRFYWIHSGLRFAIDLTFITDTLRVERSQLYGPEWWYPPRDSVLAAVLLRHGHSMAEFTAFLYMTCTQEYDSLRARYTLAGRGGAFTNGVGTGKGYGISWWDVTRADHNAGNNWLMVHEFNHQLDDIFMVSGYPEYWFNHISPTLGTAAAFGEHFDANSWILRIVPPEEWYDLRYTTRSLTRDADGDGIPDNDPSLPSDEKRLGSDSTLADTDGDGVPDFDELGFSNWIIEGWGETYGGAHRFPNLRSADADSDGTPDRLDPYPCYATTPAIPAIPYAASGPDASISPSVFASLRDPKITAVISSAWNEQFLRVVIGMDRPAPVKLMLDAGADGWFLGRGNYLITVKPGPGDSISSGLQIFDATDPARWPSMNAELARSIALTCRRHPREDGGTTITIDIPCSAVTGLSLREGDEVGLSIGFLCPFGEPGSQRYVDLFEPNRLVTFRLTR